MISKDSDKKLFLLDAYALIFRAYYAFIRAPRINSKGLNTGAMFGFTNTLLDILHNEKPSHIAVVFDAPEQTLREIDYEAYKANRGETPEDIKLAVPWIQKIIEGFRIPMLIAPGYEADDVVGTLAKHAEAAGFQTYMMTSDKDYGQLVSENIFVYKPGYQGGKAEILGIAEVLAKFDIERIDQVTDLLGMMGDAVDNIPGIPGVGEKTASKLLKQFGSLENLLDNSHQLKGKQKENVEQFREQAIMSKRLATILLDAPVPFDEEQLRLKDMNRDLLRETFQDLEFRQLAKRILQEDIEQMPSKQGELFSLDAFETPVPEAEKEQIQLKTIDDVNPHYTLVNTPALQQDMLAELMGADVFCFDTETSDLDPFRAQAVGLSFSIRPGEGWYVPMPSTEEAIKEALLPFVNLFSNPSKTLVAQNYKFDYKILKKYGIHPQNKVFDTMVAHYLINPDGKHNMDYLSEVYLGYRPISIESLIGKKGKSQGSMADLSPEEIVRYASEDADITLQLKRVFDPELDQAGTRNLFDEVEVPLIRVLADMEWEGVRIDEGFLNDYSKTLEQELRVLEEQIHGLAGETFNIDSPKQLGVILFEKMKITDQIKKTKTGQYSTGEDVLSKFEHDHPIVSHLLDYRELRKLKSTYVDSLPALVNPVTGRVHTSYMQTVAATGRLSSSQPNLQNIPIRTLRGKEIRKAFVPRNSEYTLLSADYSQVELRVIAALSGDPNMCEAFRLGEDIHKATAAKIFGVEVASVDKEMRSKAKAVNFGIIYGQGAFGLAQNLGISRGEAKNIIDAYFAQFSTLRSYQTDSVQRAREKGYVETILGRRRYLPDLHSANAVVRGFAERNAINAPIQGSAADIIKKAMIRIHEEMEKRQLRSRMILQVHDELVFDVHLSEVEEMRLLVSEGMSKAVELIVPLEVDMNTGAHWLEAH